MTTAGYYDIHRKQSTREEATIGNAGTYNYSMVKHNSTHRAFICPNRLVYVNIHMTKPIA